MNTKSIVFLVLSVGCAWGQTRIVPHVTDANGSFDTFITLQNTSQEIQNVVLHGFAADGTPIGDVAIAVPANETPTYEAHGLFQSAELSHFTITADAKLVVIAGYRVKIGRGSTAHLLEQNQQTYTYQLMKGDWHEVFDGLAMVNTGTKTAIIDFYQFNKYGTPINQIQLDYILAPMAKKLYVIGGPAGSFFNVKPDDYFEIRASQPMAVIALRGTVAGEPVGLLWSNPLIPINILYPF
ncbi:MAG: hypothetical protein KDC71_18305 [Acidobacteria bacterium]|nr:hypothetical protein [Acidobacteriota bacterium]